MNTQRITISFPNYLYEFLTKKIPPRKVSGFVAQAVEKELLKVDQDPVEGFIAMRQKLPKFKTAAIIKAIRQGRE